jgi:hypothetical protein
MPPLKLVPCWRICPVARSGFPTENPMGISEVGQNDGEDHSCANSNRLPDYNRPRLKTCLPSQVTRLSASALSEAC